MGKNSSFRPATGDAGDQPAVVRGHHRTPRTTAQVAAYLALVQAALDLRAEIQALFKSVDLTEAQYNVLRILRGAGAEGGGVTCGHIGEQLIHKDPDVTRLVDRLKRRQLIERSRDPRDRRVVRTRITAKGLALLASLDEPLDALHERQLGHLDERQLADLQALAQAARQRVGSARPAEH